MKIISSKLLALVLLVILAAAVSVKAGPGHDRPSGHHGPASREVRAYYRENVLPVVRQQRQKLESQLLAAEQAELATYRAQLKDLHQRGQELHQRIRPADKDAGGRPVLTDAQKQQRQQLHADRKAIMEKVKVLAVKYDASIQRLADEVAPQQEKWAADIKGIVAKYPVPEQTGAGKRFEGMRGHHNGLRKPFGPVKFLLMVPAASAAAPIETGKSSIYPNPVGASSQLEYGVKKSGPVSIDLLDSRGNKLRTVLEEANQEKGTHSLPLNVSDLPNGTYYYKITTRSGSEAKRFVKE